MKIISAPRGAGKTTFCIRESTTTGAHILVATENEKKYINITYEKMVENKDISDTPLPTIYTVSDLVRDQIPPETKVIIDELDRVLDILVGGHNVHVVAATLTPYLSLHGSEV